MRFSRIFWSRRRTSKSIRWLRGCDFSYWEPCGYHPLRGQTRIILLFADHSNARGATPVYSLAQACRVHQWHFYLAGHGPTIGNCRIKPERHTTRCAGDCGLPYSYFSRYRCLVHAYKLRNPCLYKTAFLECLNLASLFIVQLLAVSHGISLVGEKARSLRATAAFSSSIKLCTHKLNLGIYIKSHKGKISNEASNRHYLYFSHGNECPGC